MTVKLSVVVPCYNLEAFIGPCLDSLLQQPTNFHWELLVGDDASTDASVARIESALAKASASVDLRLFTLRQNAGLVANLGRLLGETRGQYVAYLDGDDLALPGKLQTQVDYLDAHPDCAVCYHESEVFDSVSGRILGHYSRDFYNASYIPERAGLRELLRYGTFLQASAVVFRRHAQMQELLDPACRIIVDYPMHVANAALIGGTIDRIPVTLGRYRQHSASFGAQTARSLERREAVLGELLRTCDRALNLGAEPEDVRLGKMHFRYAAALYFLRAGDDARFLSHIEQASAGGDYFDERHRSAWLGRDDPTRLRDQLFPGIIVGSRS